MAICLEKRKNDQFREGHGFLLLPRALRNVPLFLLKKLNSFQRNPF